MFNEPLHDPKDVTVQDKLHTLAEAFSEFEQVTHFVAMSQVAMLANPEFELDESSAEMFCFASQGMARRAEALAAQLQALLEDVRSG